MRRRRPINMIAYSMAAAGIARQRGVPLTCRDALADSALKEAIWRAMFWRRDHPVLRIRDFSQPGPRRLSSALRNG